MPESGDIWMLERVISGGQTGVDRGVLDAALQLGVACGGWCPQGRRAEDGPIHPRYPLRETASDAYAERTRLNILNSDGTLVLVDGQPAGGTALTLSEIRRRDLPCHIMPPTAGRVMEAVAWIRRNQIRVLNVAGPRESEVRGVHGRAYDFMLALLRGLPVQRANTGPWNPRAR